MTKKIITLLLVAVSISIFAVDFSYNMSAIDASTYYTENAASNSYESKAAKAIAYIAENENATYQDIVDLIGNENTLNLVYHYIFPNIVSDYKTKFSTMFYDQLNNNFSEIKNLDFFKQIIVGTDYWFHESAPTLGVYGKIEGNYSKEEIRQIISTSFEQLIEKASNCENYEAGYNGLLLNYIKSYQAIYLDCDENVVKTDLKKLNAKAFMLLDVSEEYKTFVTRLRMLYKSLDF